MEEVEVVKKDTVDTSDHTDKSEESDILGTEFTSYAPFANNAPRDDAAINGDGSEVISVNVLAKKDGGPKALKITGEQW